jgi:hypothetical protein
MTGIPFEIRAEGNPDETETVYLSTRRTGDIGRKMETLKQQIRNHDISRAAALRRAALCSHKCDALAKSSPTFARDLDALGEQQDVALFQATQLAGELNAARADLVRLSLSSNYGDRTDNILDRLTDVELQAAVSLIETGELPADFFGARGTQRKSSTTSQSGAPQPAPSSPPASPERTSPPPD